MNQILKKIVLENKNKDIKGPFKMTSHKYEDGGVIICVTLCMKVLVKRPFQHDRGKRGVDFESKLCDIIYKCPLRAAKQ